MAQRILLPCGSLLGNFIYAKLLPTKSQNPREGRDFEDHPPPPLTGDHSPPHLNLDPRLSACQSSDAFLGDSRALSPYSLDCLTSRSI